MGDYPKSDGFSIRENAALAALHKQSEDWQVAKAEQAERLKAMSKDEIKAARKEKREANKSDFIESILLANESKEIKKLYREGRDNLKPEHVAGIMLATMGKLLEDGRNNKIEMLRVYTTIPKLAEIMRRNIGPTPPPKVDFTGLSINAGADTGANSAESDEVIFQ